MTDPPTDPPTDPHPDRAPGPRPGRLLARAALLAPGWLAALVVAAAVGTCATLLVPAALARAVDAVLEGGPVAPAALRLAVLLAGVVGCLLAAQISETYCVVAATARLRGEVVGHVLALGLAGQQRFAAGDVAGRTGTATVHTALAAPLVVDAVTGVATSLGAVVLLWRVDWRVVATLGVAAPAGAVLAGTFARRVTHLTRRYQELQGAMAGRLVEALGGVRTIRSAGTVDREVARVLAPLPGLAAAGHAVWRDYGRMVGRASLLAPLTGLAALAVAGHGVAAGWVSPGELVAVAGYVPMALGMLDQTGLLLRWGRVRAGAARLAEVLAVPAPPHGARELPPGPGELVLRDVTVRRGGRVLLDRLDLTLPPGRVTAVVGRSGAGKSTLAAVAGRLIDPDRGQVLLDGVPLAELAPTALRDAVSYAFERPRLLGATVAEAIGYGRAVAPERIERAARAARAEAFIRRLPGGFDTPLEQAPMSGGELQRVGLARTLVPDSRLLVIDDATSGLDAVTEAQIGAALAEVAAGRTRLVVAHRARTAARADQVAWLDGGRLRALAPHRSLWAVPEYRALFAAPPEHPPGGPAPGAVPDGAGVPP